MRLPCLAFSLLLALAAPGAGAHDTIHRHVGVGFMFGPPILQPWYVPPTPYYPGPVVVMPPPPPVYVERSDPPDLPGGYWYHCTQPRGYFPNVRQCPGGWQRIAPPPE